MQDVRAAQQLPCNCRAPDSAVPTQPASCSPHPFEPHPPHHTQVDSTAGITAGQWVRVYAAPQDGGAPELQVSAQVAALGAGYIDLDRQLPFPGATACCAAAAAADDCC